MLDLLTTRTRLSQHLSKLLIFLALALLPNCSQAQNYPIHDVRVIDGDTVEATIDLPWDITLRTQSIRFVGFDAWETTRRRQGIVITDEEIVRGKLAKEDLENLIKTSHEVYVRPAGKRDSFGRILGNIYVRIKSLDGLTSVNRWMIERGHSRD